MTRGTRSSAFIASGAIKLINDIRPSPLRRSTVDAIGRGSVESSEIGLFAPVLDEDRPHELVEAAAVGAEPLAEQALFHGAKLEERTVGAAVGDHGARFEAIDADGVE